MKLMIIREDGDAQNERANALKYWSNARGELHHHWQYYITEDELPAPLRKAYNELWGEDYGSYCYLVETENGYGVALVNEYDETFAEYCGMTMKELFDSCVIDAINIARSDVFDGAQVFAFEESEFEECHELIVIFPADTERDKFVAAADALYDTYAYQNAHKRIGRK